MAAFSHWLERLPSSEEGAPGDLRFLERLVRAFSWHAGTGSRSVDPARTIVVADFEPPREWLENLPCGLPAFLAIPQAPLRPVPGIEYALLRTDRNPLDWGPEIDARIPRRIRNVLVLGRFDRIFGRTLSHWARLGISSVHFLGEKTPVTIPPLAGWCIKAARRLGNRLLGTRVRERNAEENAALLDLVDSGGRTSQRTPGRQRVVHYINHLGSGGAERQLCNLAILQQQRGQDVRVFTQAPVVGDFGHYREILEDANLAVRHAGSTWNQAFPALLIDRKGSHRFLESLPVDLQGPVADLAGELLTREADVLHCWLDRPCIVGLLAGRLAGVPAIVLSLRNVHPGRIAHLHEPWMRAWYQVAAGLPGVALVNNSEAGARDYEDWLGLPWGSIRVLRNAFVPPENPAAADVASLRESLGISAQTPVVAGIFRLDPEKRPFHFLEVIRRLHQRIPGLRVLHAGKGRLEGALRDAIARLGLVEVVHLLGNRSDVPTLLAASRILLLTSEQEGTPNVVLEAQQVGCVPVATDAGGTREALVAGVTGRLLPPDNLDELVSACVDLLQNEPHRLRLAVAGRAFLADRFHPGKVFAATQALYDSLLHARIRPLAQAG